VYDDKTIVLYSCVLPDDGPVRLETLSSLCILNCRYCNWREMCAVLVCIVTNEVTDFRNEATKLLIATTNIFVQLKTFNKISQHCK